MRLASKFYRRLMCRLVPSNELIKQHSAASLSNVRFSRMHPHRKPRYDQVSTWPPTKDMRRISCRTHARTHVLYRGYHAAACFNYSLFFLSYILFLSFSRRKWILCRGFVEPSPPDTIYLIVKIGNTRWSCNVMKTARMYSLSVSLFLCYYVTHGKRSRYSHARYEMQRLAKRIRSKIRG